MSDPGPDSLEARTGRIATTLRAALRGLLDELVPNDRYRPRDLVDELGLDKSLASRLVRALETEDPVAFLLEAPSPHGLRLVLRALRWHGRVAADLELAAASVAALEALEGEFAGGRADLETVLTGWRPDARASRDRRARQALFRGLVHLTGTRVDRQAFAHVWSPNPDGRTVDSAWIDVRDGLRRLRNDSPLVFLRLEDGGSDGPARRETLAGEPVRNALDLVVEELSTKPLPELDARRAAQACELFLAANAPPINRPVTLAVGVSESAHGPRCRTPDRRWAQVSFVPCQPTRRVLLDVFVHRDLFVPGSLRLSSRIDGATSPDAARDVTDEVRHLASAREDLAHPEVPGTELLAETLLAGRGLDPAAFRVHRWFGAYPVPTGRLTFRYELPGA